MTLLVLVFWLDGISQEARFKMYGERNHDRVTLAWVPESWPAGMTGVIIKTKAEDESWLELSGSEISPASYLTKDLSNVEPLPTEQSRLKEKLNKMMAAGRAQPVSQNEFINKLSSNSEMGGAVAMIFAMDYDLMLLNGFGLVDRRTNLSDSTTYGIFPVINGISSPEPVSELTVFSQEQPSIEMNGKIEVVGNKKKIRLIWEFTLDVYRKSGIKGYDIIVDFEGTKTKLNQAPIWITSNQEPGILSFVTDFPSKERSYCAVPVSYFNSSRLANCIDINPKYYTMIFPPPELNVKLIKNSAELEWAMDHSLDSLVESIIVWEWLDSTYHKIAELDSRQRQYHISDIKKGQKRYRISLLTKAGHEINSNLKIVNYNPQTIVPKPFDLFGNVISDSTGRHVQLSWNYPDSASDNTFRIFTAGPDGDMIFDYALSKNVKSPFRIPVLTSMGTRNLFAVQAMDTNRNKSELSNIISVVAPSKQLPTPRVVSVEQIDGETVLKWDYSERYLDLKGFRILINGVPTLNENQIQKSLREANLPFSESGIHSVSLQSISIYGLESELSIPFKFKID